MAAGGLYIPLKAVFDDKGFKEAQKSMGSLGSAMKKTLGAVGLTVGIGALVNQLNRAGKAAVEDAKSQGLLALSLRNTINATDDQISAVEKSISAMELMSSVADDKIRPAFATIAAVTGDVTKATSLTTLALDMAAAGYGTVETNSKALAKAYGGQTTALDRLVPGVRNATDKFAYLQERFAGTAEAAADLDPYTRMNLIFGNLQEAIGKYLLPYLQDFANWLASPPGQEKLQAIAATFGTIVTAVGNMVNFLMDNTWLVKTVAGLVAMFKVWKAIFLVTKAIYGAQKAAALVTFAQKGLESAKGWPAIAAAASAVAAGLGTFIALDAMIGNITDNVEQLKQDSGKVSTTTFDFGTGTGNENGTTTGTKGKTPAQIAAEAAAKAAATAMAAYQKLAASMQEFKASMGEVLAGVRPLETATRIVGEFEQASIDAFTQVQEKVADALKSGLVSAATYDALVKYAAREAKVLNQIAAQRDAIAKKIDIAKNLVSTVRDYVSISDLGATSAEITSGFRSIIDKTVDFGKNLLALKKAGLDRNLFAQILGAGLEAGGQTAQAIVDGGDSAITELNGLFKELNNAAEGIAVASTDIMYSVGEEIISNGFIAGLMDQDSALVKAAQALADAFTSTFSTGLATGMAEQLSKIQPPSVSVPLSSTVTPLSGGMAAQLGQLGFKNTADAYIRRDSMGQSFLTTKAGITINVNAGMGTDGKSVAQSIIDEIKRYERANGAVWTAAT
jgi:hypothetical protein